MEYRIEPDVFEGHPGYVRGVVLVRGAFNAGDPSALEEALRIEEVRVRERLAGASIPDHPAVAAWREAYRRFGAKPSEHRSSIEAMLRRVLKPDRLPVINPLVAIGNIVSLRYLLPAGVHPWTSQGPDLVLRVAHDADTFVPPGESARESPWPPEIVFAQGSQVLTRRWTWRQAAGTQTLPETTDVFFNVDGMPPVDLATVRQAMQDVESLVAAHTGGRIAASGVLSRAGASMALPSP